MKYFISYIVFLSLIPMACLSQMPQTNVFLIDYDLVDGKYYSKNVINISNGSGYNNQPRILKGCNSILYTSNSNDSTQTELMEYDIKNQKNIKITNSALSEYSPRKKPGQNIISYVKVETDKKQHLYMADETNADQVNLVTSSDSIGYYDWLGSNQLGLILLNNGLEFHTYKIGEDQTTFVFDSVGRFIEYHEPSAEIYFLSKSILHPGIKIYDINEKTIKKTVTAMEGTEDYSIDINGFLHGGNNGKLYRFYENHWQEMLDLKPHTGDFYRLTFCECGHHMCVVSFTGKKP